jgi:hypothetical protein
VLREREAMAARSRIRDPDGSAHRGRNVAGEGCTDVAGLEHLEVFCGVTSDRRKLVLFGPVVVRRHHWQP